MDGSDDVVGVLVGQWPLPVNVAVFAVAAAVTAVGDVFYRGSSLYHEAGPDELFLTLASVLMTVVVIGGLLVRQSRGWARVGFEGVALVGMYGAIVAVPSF